jgi:hypothetical protein
MTNVTQSGSPPWQLYPSFVEERVPCIVKQDMPGHALVSPTSALAPGEYAVVLRPVSKQKKFSGSDISQDSGDGLLFNSVWSFKVK